MAWPTAGAESGPGAAARRRLRTLSGGGAVGDARWAPAEGMTLRAGCTCRSFSALRRRPGARPQQGSQRSEGGEVEVGLPWSLPSRGGRRKRSGPGWVPRMHLIYAQMPDVSVFLI